ncbi:MAG: TonB-dependent receptor, partial [Acidobacteria bacterium]|nr:TonB-dependent receptor [Acidobacteriota bacterium]
MRFLSVSLLVCVPAALFGQSNATVQGQITDQTGAAVPGATVTVTNTGTGVSVTTKSDSTGNYQVPALVIGNYDVNVDASGLQKAIAKGLVLEVGRTTVQNFQLKVAQASEVLTVEGEAPVIETASITVGQTIEQKTVQEIPLNGRHFVDLALLTPGTVIPPANGFLTAPLRGQGAFGIVTAGEREDTTNYMINGINLNDMANGQVTFQPTIDTVSEFTINNQTPSAEYGRNSGATLNIATRSGTNQFHGEAYEFLRNNDLDARNFFNPSGTPMNPFKRNQFGGDIGGPIIHDKTFFFGSYEGLRQRQGLAFSSPVPSAAQRALVTDPNLQKLLTLVPAGVQPAAGSPIATTAQFTGSGVAPVNIDQGTGDIQHNFSDRDRLHGYYVFQRDQRLEPNLSAATIPGGGDARQSHRQLFTLDESHVFADNLVNDFRFGFNRIHITFVTDVQNAGLDPTSFGIQDGQAGAVGIPQVVVTGGLIFGGEVGFPQGRGDVTAVTSDTVSYLHGNHSVKFGGEYRRFIGNTIGGDEGRITFSSFAALLGCSAAFTGCGAAAPSAFQINLGGNHPARISEPAMGFFGTDSWKVRPYLTLELGLRWEWNFTPTEAQNRSSVFLPAQSWLAQIGTSVRPLEYHQNNKLFQPRVGFSWDVFRNGKTVVRSGYGLLYDEPLPIISNANPPFGLPLTFTSSKAKPATSFSTLLTDASGGISPSSVNPDYHDGYMQSYNLNVQQQITPTTGVMIGYFGSKGTHLNMQLNQNQLVPGATPGVYVRPFANLAADSPIIPVAPNGTRLTALGNITDNESIGYSHYDALWITGT